MALPPPPLPMPSHPPPASSSPPPTFYYPSLRQMNGVVVGVLVVLVLLVLLLTLVKAWRTWLHSRVRRGGALEGGMAEGVEGQQLHGAHGTARGLNEDAIARVGKTYSFKSVSSVEKGGEVGGEGEKGGAGGGKDRDMGLLKSTSLKLHNDVAKSLSLESECIVCLAEYKDGDVCRKLDACGHSFHVDCIDAWLRTNTSCPLCRTELQPKEEELPASTAAGRGAEGATQQRRGEGAFVSISIN